MEMPAPMLLAPPRVPHWMTGTSSAGLPVYLAHTSTVQSEEPKMVAWEIHTLLLNVPAYESRRLGCEELAVKLTAATPPDVTSAGVATLPPVSV